jgi:hypothetical protein
MAFCPASPLALSALAKALGLEDRMVTSISINAFVDGLTLVNVNMYLEDEREGTLVEVLKDFVLVEREPAFVIDDRGKAVVTNPAKLGNIITQWFHR